MGALRSAIEELAATDLAEISDEELDTDVAEIGRAISMLTAQLVSRVAVACRRRSFEGGGFPNATQWLAVRADLDGGSARRMVAMAAALENHPQTASRFESGEMSVTRARVLTRAATTHPEHYRRDEEMLLGFADDMTVRNFAHAVRYWSHCADDAAEDTAQRQREKAHLHVSRLLNGMTRLDGVLDPEAAEAVVAALESAVSPPTVHDRRSSANRRAHALGEICEQWLRNGTMISGGVKPHVSLIVDLATLTGRMGERCHLERNGPITPETARRIMCDADVSRVVMQGESQILDVGRATRVPTPAIRHALVIRDGGCRFSGCDRPPQWCDAHHIVHWLDGGPMALVNLILLCRYHHTRVHQGLATIHDGEVVLV